GPLTPPPQLAAAASCFLRLPGAASTPTKLLRIKPARRPWRYAMCPCWRCPRHSCCPAPTPGGPDATGDALMSQSLADMRREYTRDGLSEAQAPDEPFALFKQWFE